MHFIHLFKKIKTNEQTAASLPDVSLVKTSVQSRKGNEIIKLLWKRWTIGYSEKASVKKKICDQGLHWRNLPWVQFILLTQEETRALWLLSIAIWNIGQKTILRVACCYVIKDVVSNETLYLQDLEMHQCLVCWLPVQSGEVCMVHILIFLFHSCYKGTKKRTLCICSSFFRPGKLNQFVGFQKLIRLWYKLCNQPWQGCHLSWGVFRLTF